MEPRTDARAKRKLWGMIKDIRVAMLTTQDDLGCLRSRPMVAHQETFDGDLWFFTRAAAPKVSEVERHHQVNLSYAEPKDQNYVSVSGWAELVRDPNAIQQLWSEPLRAWFPKGPNDPSVALLKVRVEHAEFWDSPAAAMVMAYGYVKAAVTGEPASPGETGRIDYH